MRITRRFQYVPYLIDGRVKPSVLTILQKLYHQTLAIRPKLIKLIEKYSQKKGEYIRSFAVRTHAYRP